MLTHERMNDTLNFSIVNVVFFFFEILYVFYTNDTKHQHVLENLHITVTCDEKIFVFKYFLTYALELQYYF